MMRKVLYLVLCCCLVSVLASADGSISRPPTLSICEVNCATAYTSCSAGCLAGPSQIPCLSNCSFTHETCQNHCLFIPL